MLEDVDLFEKIKQHIKSDSELNKNINARTLEKEIEDEIYTSVIIKRNDSTGINLDDAFNKVIAESCKICNKNNISIFLSSISAGFYLGFSILCVAMVSPIEFSFASGNFNHLFQAFFYPIGFILCIMNGSILFTEQTALAIYPVLIKNLKLSKLISFWSIVIAGNLLGAFVIALFLTFADNVLNIKFEVIDLTLSMISFDSSDIFISSILAGLLMAHGSWLLKTTSSTITQIFYIVLVTFIIGIGELHHSIAGSVKIFYTIFNIDQYISILNLMNVLVVMILGNLVGGVFFIALYNFIHFKKNLSF